MDELVASGLPLWKAAAFAHDPHLMTLDARCRAESEARRRAENGLCLAEIEPVTTTASKAVQSVSVFVCTVIKPCPTHDADLFVAMGYGQNSGSNEVAS